MSPYQKFTKDIGIVGLTNSLIFLKGLLILPIITKLLGVENYGVWTQLGVTISLITPLCLLGLPQAMVRFLAAEKEKEEIQEGIFSVLAVIFSFALIIGAFLILFAQPLADFFQGPVILIKILALIILFECLNLVLISLFQVSQEIPKYSFFTIFQSFGEVGLVALAVFSGYGLLGATMSLLIIRVLNFLILFGLNLKKFGILLPRFVKIKNYLKFGLPLVVSSVSYWIITSSDRYLIGFFLGVLFVGYYAPAYALGNTINFFIYPLSFVLFPVLSKLYDENRIHEVKTFLRYSLKYFLMVALPAMFGLSVLTKQLLTIFSTAEVAQNSYFVTPFIAFSIVLYGIYAIFNEILRLVKKTKLSGSIWLVASILNLGLNLIFIPVFGILAAALTTLFSYTFAFLLILYFSLKELRFEIDWKFIIKSVFASLLMVFFIIWFSPMGLLKTMVAIFGGAVIYGILIIVLKGFDKKEFDFFRGLFLQKL